MLVQALMLAVVALNNRQYIVTMGTIRPDSHGHAWGKSPRHAQNPYVIGRVKENDLNN